jgi:hypothetical protein
MDIFMKRFLVVFLFAIALPRYEPAYEQHDPILLDGVHATADEPYIIEGYEITNPKGDCIKILNSEHVIIKNNYLHGCGTDKEFQQRTDHYSEGYATLVGKSEYITFENNTLDGNFRGFMAYSTAHLNGANNQITNTLQYSPLWCERCDHSEFSNNYLEDNGDPEVFWVSGVRAIGIWVKRSDQVSIHGNVVIRSTSDGIAVTGQIYGPSFTVPETFGKEPRDDWSGYSMNVQVYDNLILDNMEQGIWLVNARDVKAYNNVIRTGCFTHGSSISMEFNVGNAELYGNKLLTCNSGPPGGDYSFNINIHDNIYYSWDGEYGDFMYFSNGELGTTQEKKNGAPYEEPHGNREEGNIWVGIEGALADEMIAKREYAELHKTYEPKGWFRCELADGSIDEECRKSEEAKGDQGVPREMLLYSSPMADFDAFVVGQGGPDKGKPEERRDESEYEVGKGEEKKQSDQEAVANGAPQSEGQSSSDHDPINEGLMGYWQAPMIGLFVLAGVVAVARAALKRRTK